VQNLNYLELFVYNVIVSSLTPLTRINCSCEDVFTCLYNLSSSDIQVLAILLRAKDQEGLTLEFLRKHVNRDKGTVFRSLQKLVGLGFSTKHTRTLKQGGYYHVYAAADVNTIEKNVNQRIIEIESSLNRIKRKFRADIKKIVSAKVLQTSVAD
jgi:predicted transcriptional regulator